MIGSSRYNNSRLLNSAFTIVELMAVIVVLAILVSVVAVSYRGVTERAQNAQIVTTIDTYRTALKLYHAKHGRFPEIASPICLGRTSDYPAEGNYIEGACDSGGYYMTDEDVNQELEYYTGGYIDSTMPDLELFGLSARGLMLFPDGDGVSISYLIAGNECPLGEVANSENSVTFCMLDI